MAGKQYSSLGRDDDSGYLGVASHGHFSAGADEVEDDVVPLDATGKHDPGMPEQGELLANVNDEPRRCRAFESQSLVTGQHKLTQS